MYIRVLLVALTQPFHWSRNRLTQARFPFSTYLLYTGMVPYPTLPNLLSLLFLFQRPAATPNQLVILYIDFPPCVFGELQAQHQSYRSIDCYVIRISSKGVLYKKRDEEGEIQPEWNFSCIVARKERFFVRNLAI